MTNDGVVGRPHQSDHVDGRLTHVHESRSTPVRPTNRRILRRVAVAGGVALAAVALTPLAANADTPVNYGSTDSVPFAMFTPDSDGYTHYSNNNGSWTNCGPDYCTVYLSRAATQALYSDAVHWGQVARSGAVQAACTAAFGYGGDAAAEALNFGKLAKGTAVVLVAGAGYALCADLANGTIPSDLVTAGENNECYQVTTYGAPAGHTNHPAYCYDN